MLVNVLFDYALGHGRCVGVAIPDSPEDVEALAVAALLPAERVTHARAPLPRRRTWVGGRAAMRCALARLGVDAPPIAVDDRGAPVLPPRVIGSISHKDAVAVALVAAGEGARIGVDVEIELGDPTRRLDVSSRILADDEQGELNMVAPPGSQERPREVLLRFSAKEALYKALDPFVRRYVGFKEVRVSPRPGGTAVVVLRLRDGEGPFEAEVTWRCADGLILTTARVEPRQRGI